MDISLWSGCFSSISGFDSDSRAHLRSESVQRFIYFTKLNTLTQEKSLLASRGNRVLSILIGHKFMKQMFSSISGFDSDSRPQFRSESVQRFIYFPNWILCPQEKSLLASRGNRVSSILFGHNFMKQMFFFNFGFWFGSRPQFRPESVQRFVYFM